MAEAGSQTDPAHFELPGPGEPAAETPDPGTEPGFSAHAATQTHASGLLATQADVLIGAEAACGSSWMTQEDFVDVSCQCSGVPIEDPANLEVDRLRMGLEDRRV